MPVRLQIKLETPLTTTVEGYLLLAQQQVLLPLAQILGLPQLPHHQLLKFWLLVEVVAVAQDIMREEVVPAA
jgi:hypothetical protein